MLSILLTKSDTYGDQRDSCFHVFGQREVFYLFDWRNLNAKQLSKSFVFNLLSRYFAYKAFSSFFKVFYLIWEMWLGRRVFLERRADVR